MKTWEAASAQRLVKLAPFLMSLSVFGLLLLALGWFSHFHLSIQIGLGSSQKGTAEPQRVSAWSWYSVVFSLTVEWVLIMKGSGLSSGIRWSCCPLKWKIKCTGQNGLLIQTFVALFFTIKEYPIHNLHYIHKALYFLLQAKRTRKWENNSLLHGTCYLDVTVNPIIF